MTTFGELKDELRRIIWPSGEAENLVVAHNKMFEEGIVAIQRHNVCQQRHNVTQIPFCATYFRCGMTVAEAPKGHIRKVYVIANNQWCDAVIYRQTEYPRIEAFTRNHVLDYTPPLQPENPQNLPSLPVGFLYSDKSSDSEIGRSRWSVWWAIDRRRIYLSPYIQSNETVIVEWDGIKSDHWLDTDLVNDEIDFKQALKYFVMSQDMAQNGMDQKGALYYKAEFDNANAELIFECREQTRVREHVHEVTDIEEILPLAAEVEDDVVPDADPPVVFACVADFGGGQIDSINVANMIASWNPNFITTQGDNWYGNSLSTTSLDDWAGQLYHDYIYPYTGAYGSGAPGINKFWAVYGNHDCDPVGRLPVEFAFFGRERPYYDVVLGHIHFFMVFSPYNGPQNITPGFKDGDTYDSVQGQWLKAVMQASKSRWKIVMFHHPPYSSLAHANNSPQLAGDGTTSYIRMRWPFKEWGADLVMTGHAHVYERSLAPEGYPLITNGWGGQTLNTALITPGPYSKKTYNADYGAIRGTVTCNELKLEAINQVGVLIETFTLTKT